MLEGSYDVVHNAALREMAAPGPVGEITMATAMSSGFRRVPESTCKSLLNLSS